MNLFIVDCKNKHLIDNVFLDPRKNILLIYGKKDSSFFKVCSNIHFVSSLSDCKKYFKFANKVILVDKISFIDPLGIKKINTIPKGSFYASSFSNDDEIYMMQVMGILPEILNGRWHDNYINENKLSELDLEEDLIENFIFEKDKSKFNFVKYKTQTSRDILISSKIKKLSNSINSKQNISELIDKFHKEDDLFLSSKVWYYKKDLNGYSDRLYKTYKH